jgi:hypothetical protein
VSFDLLVFDPKVAPRDRKGFLAWFDLQAEWPEDHGYNNPDVCSPDLRAWFHDMREAFPPLNGPHASDDYDNQRIADYSIGKSLIYVGFRWSEVETAYEKMFELAKKHRVGLYYVSADDGEVWAPSEDGSYTLVHGTSAVPGGNNENSVAIVLTTKKDED